MQINEQSGISRYAILDCAVHDNAYNELTDRFKHIHWHSLFQGTPEEDLVAASPILIEIPSGDDKLQLIEWLLSHERIVPSVSWIDSHLSLPVLGTALTNRMPCMINDGQMVVLRFWDPRILLGLPSALDVEQRRHFFAPVNQWTAWEQRRQQYYTIAAPTDAARVPRFLAIPMHLTEVQREQLTYYDKEVLYERIVKHWIDTCPDAIDGMEPAMLREIAIAAVARCSSYGIHSASDQILFAGLMMSVSPSFDDYPVVQRALRNEAIDPAQRLDCIIDELPDAAWDQIRREKRYDALFEHQPLAMA